jgi:hypothetical protein
MNSDEIYRLKQERKDKEYVYEQWRKILTMHVVNEEINRNIKDSITVTSEQLRTVFNNGYKLAMHQNFLAIENLLDFSNETNRNEFDQLLEQIRDRLTTSDCIETHKDKLFGLSLIDALKRSKEFDRFTNKDFCSWGSKSM